MTYRIQAIEYGPEASATLTQASADLGLDRAVVALLLARCSSRLRDQLALPESPIDIAGELLSVKGVAGLIEVAPGFELEVSPKFLGTENDWREDFFVFAALSKYGSILDRDVVAGGFGAARDLATLIGRTALRLYERNRRNPLRLYRGQEWRAFEVEGEVEAEEFLVPSADGFLQSSLIFDRRNEFSDVMSRAFGTLASEVREPGTRERVRRVGNSFPRVMRQRPPLRRVPSRHSRWQPLYDLSLAVLNGTRLDYSSAGATALGYAIKTADGWQDFLSLALETTMGSVAVQRSRPYSLGTRAGCDVPTTPDLTVRVGSKVVLVDAKYKGRAWRPLNQIGAADLYEAFAFARAAKLDEVILMYPRPASLPRTPLGSLSAFDEVLVESCRIVGVDVECRGISQLGGFRTFGESLERGLTVIT